MRIIQEGLAKDPRFPMECKCFCCGTVLEVDEYDVVKERGYGAKCPICGSYISLPELSTYTFPQNFDFSGGDSAAYIEDKRINKWIDKGLKFFKENPDSFCYMTASGNAVVFVLNFSGDEEYHVIVCRNYYDAFIPYTEEDYDIQDANDWEWHNKGVNDEQDFSTSKHILSS